MRLFSLLGLTFLLTTSVLAHPSSIQLTPNKLQVLADAYLKQYREIENISAVALTADSGKNLTTVCSGYTEFSGKQPVNSTSLYQIGSITKSFISAVILQLEATPELHFNINDKLSAYLPQYSEWGNVTIKQMLNMTSGIPDYLADDKYLQDLANDSYKQWLPEEEISYVAKKPLLFLPGTKWNYSNTNYILAGMIITKLTGHTVEEEINSRFLAPNNSSHLRLQNTFYISHQYPSRIIPRMVHGYHLGGTIGKFIPLKADLTMFSLSYAGAAGAVVSNTEDITHWVRSLLTVNKVLPPKQLEELTTLVSQQTGKLLKTPDESDPDGFGLGIGLSYAGADIPGLIFNYAGMTMGYRAIYFYFLNQNLILAAATNSSENDNNEHLRELLVNAYQVLIKNPS